MGGTWTHSRARPCPVCGGGKDQPHGTGLYCWGKTIDITTICTRDDHAGALDQRGTGFHHRNTGSCKCGTQHGGPGEYTAPRAYWAPPAPVRTVDGEGHLAPYLAPGASLTEASFDPDLPVSEHYFAIRDLEGSVIAFHRRIEFAGGSKKMPWEPATPGGDLPATEDMLFGLEQLRYLPKGARILLCEGEKAALAARKRGLVALATVCGATGTPSPHVLRSLLPYSVYLCPDADDAGVKHMRATASRLDDLGGVAYVCPPLPNAAKGDDLADLYKDPDDDPEIIDELLIDYLETAVRFAPSLAPQPGELVSDVQDARKRASARRARATNLIALVSEALSQLPYFSHSAGLMADCRKHWNAALCSLKAGGCDTRLAFPRSCGQRACPTCFVSGILGLAHKHAAEYGEGRVFRRYRLDPVNPVPADHARPLSLLSERFATARDRAQVASGWYSSVYDRDGRHYLMLCVDADGPQPGAEFGGFAVTPLDDGTLEDHAIALADAYLDEIAHFFGAGPSTSRIEAYMAAVKGRHRFVGFGKLSECPSNGTTGTQDDLPGTLKPFSGSRVEHKRGELRECPLCGAQAVTMMRLPLLPEQVRPLRRGVYTWDPRGERPE